MNIQTKTVEYKSHDDCRAAWIGNLTDSAQALIASHDQLVWEILAAMPEGHGEALSEMVDDVRLAHGASMAARFGEYVALTLTEATWNEANGELRFDTDAPSFTYADTASLSTKWCIEPEKIEAAPKATKNDNYEEDLTRLLAKVRRGLEGKRKTPRSETKRKMAQRISVLEHALREFEEISAGTYGASEEITTENPENVTDIAAKRTGTNG